jgi:tRNA pseudouridine13 synthase
MILKETPEDFIVDELFDLEELKNKDEGTNKKYYYFKLTKKNYAQIRALEIVANVFNTSKKLVHFAGNKDKIGITSQIISVRGIQESNFEKNLDYFNSKFKDMQLEFLGIFDSRINLGDNLGNKFKIVVRDLNEENIKIAKKNIEKIKEDGILNEFDSQRFGYANNSHTIGKYVLQNDIENAIYTILTSLPPNPSDELANFVDYIKDNWEEIKKQDIETIDYAISLTTKFLDKEKKILEHLKVHLNDFPGAFRKIHKKLRTMYVNAYQSYIFNVTLRELNQKDLLKNYTQIPLVNHDAEFDNTLKNITQKLLEKDNLTLDNFNLPSMPELKTSSVLREVKLYPKNIELLKIEDDEIYQERKKAKITFELVKGAYATFVIKQIFESKLK